MLGTVGATAHSDRRDKEYVSACISVGDLLSLTMILSAICCICCDLVWISSFSLLSLRSTISSLFTWFSRVFLPSCSTTDNPKMAHDQYKKRKLNVGLFICLRYAFKDQIYFIESLFSYMYIFIVWLERIVARTNKYEIYMPNGHAIKFHSFIK